jgi:hypothetical protein
MRANGLIEGEPTQNTPKLGASYLKILPIKGKPLHPGAYLSRIQVSGYELSGPVNANAVKKYFV